MGFSPQYVRHIASYPLGGRTTTVKMTAVSTEKLSMLSRNQRPVPLQLDRPAPQLRLGRRTLTAVTRARVDCTRTLIWSLNLSRKCQVLARGDDLLLPSSRPCFEDHVKRRVGGTADIAKAPGGDDLAQFGLASLRTKGGAHFLRQRRRYAAHRRAGIINTADRVQIVFKLVARHRLDDHPRAVRLQRLPDVRRRPGRVAHVVETVEEGDQVEILLRIFLGRRDLEAGICRDAMLL